MLVKHEPRHALKRTVSACFCASLVVLMCAEPASARIVRTRSVNRTDGVNLVLGIGAEFEKGEYAVPLLIEWSPTNSMTLVIEPSHGAIKEDNEWIRGWHELDTALIYDLVPVEEGRTGFALEFGVKFPTASNKDLGSGKSDYSIGLIVAREIGEGELEFNLVHTFIGDPNDERLDNETEASIAGEWELTEISDLIGEVVVGHGGGVLELDSDGSYSVSERSDFQTQVTVGLAQELTPHLTIEEGITWTSDGTWQGQIALEWDFAEED